MGKYNTRQQDKFKQIHAQVAGGAKLLKTKDKEKLLKVVREK
jgi:hypothetical protein